MADEQKSAFTELDYEVDEFDGPRNARINGTPVIIQECEIVHEDGEFAVVRLRLAGVRVTIRPRSVS